MADRSIVVRLKAEVADFRRQMALASAATEDVGRKAKATGAEASTSLGRLAQSAQRHEEAWRGTGAALLGVGAAAGAGIAVAVRAFAQFDAAMSRVQASTGETAGNMDLLRQAALDAGADTAFSATEAAGAIEALSKAGISARDVLGGGLRGALSLAAAGGIEVGEAAELAASAMTQFNLAGDEVPHIADLLAAGAGKAQGSVSDLGQALNQAGLVASQTGLTLEETTGGLAAFASAGLIGSDAGTSFKTMLQSLTPNSEAAAEAMASIGFSAFDAQGNFVGLEEVAGRLREGLAGMSAEQQNATLKTIFGSDAVRAASVLYREGADGIAEWTSAVDDTGFAAEQAAANLDNLTGDLERLRGSFETALIGSAEGADGPLRGLVQNVTDAVDSYNQLSETGKGLALGTAGVVSAIGLAGGGFLLLAPRVLDVVNGFSTLRRDAPGVADGFGRVAKGAGIAGAALGALTIAGSFLDNTNADLLSVAESADLLASKSLSMEGLNASIRALGEDSLFSGREGFDSLSEGLERLADPSLIERLQDVTYSAAGVVGLPYEKGRPEREALVEQLGSMGQALAGLATSGHAERAAEQFGLFAEAAEQAGLSEAQLLELMPAYRDALAQQSTEQTLAADSASKVATGVAQIAPAIAGVPEALQGYATALGLSEDAAQSLTDRHNALGDALVSFVDPMSVYTGLLTEKEEAERTTAQATADATADATDSWKTYVGDVTVSVEEYLHQMEKQVADQEAWQQNMLRLAGRVSQGTIDELARMGPEGAPLVADLVNASDAELDRFDDITRARSREATDAWAAQLIEAQPVLAAVGKKAGQGVVDELAAKLRAGTITVSEIARQYGINLAGGINPILTSLGRSRITISQEIGARYSAGRYAEGGIREDHTAQIAPAGAWRVWAEPETGGEAYIPLSAAKRTRSTAIWRETGKRLGVDFQEFHSGGFLDPDDVPRPRSTSPYRPPISTAGDAAMQKGYDEVVAWMRANTEPAGTPSGAGGGSSAGLVAFGRRLQAMGARVSEHPAFGGVAPVHSRNSAHYRSAAIDVNTRPGTSALEQRELAPMDRMARAAGYRTIFMAPGHYNHLHVQLAKGGILEPGGLLNPHVRDTGGPLLPGYTFNGTGAAETVVPTRHFAAQSPTVHVAAPQVTVQVEVDGQQLDHRARAIVAENNQTLAHADRYDS